MVRELQELPCTLAFLGDFFRAQNWKITLPGPYHLKAPFQMVAWKKRDSFPFEMVGIFRSLKRPPQDQV